MIILDHPSLILEQCIGNRAIGNWMINPTSLLVVASSSSALIDASVVVVDVEGTKSTTGFLSKTLVGSSERYQMIFARKMIIFR